MTTAANFDHIRCEACAVEAAKFPAHLAWCMGREWSREIDPHLCEAHTKIVADLRATAAEFELGQVGS